jgi:hypothetical protein
MDGGAVITLVIIFEIIEESSKANILLLKNSRVTNKLIPNGWRGCNYDHGLFELSTGPLGLGLPVFGFIRLLYQHLACNRWMRACLIGRSIAEALGELTKLTDVTC